MHSLKHPARLVPFGFLAAIAFGTLLLSLPIARSGPGGASPLTALFTSTSAVCVTGLVTVDTGTYWTPFGQGVILALIQVGGFGIMTGASLLGLLVSRRVRLRDRIATQLETKTLGLGDVRRVVGRIALITIVVETSVAVLLAARLWFTYDYTATDAIASGVFHAISAFNNAGFSPHSDSLMRFVTDPFVCIPIVVAVVIGGIGFPVILDIARRLRQGRHPVPRVRWSVHTKLTLWATSILLALGIAAYLALEWANARTLGPMGVVDKLLAAFFGGVMPRTAGFNSIDVASLRPETLAVTDGLMFIGGGTAGTAGGVKVTTFFLLAFVVLAEVRGEDDVSLFRRRIAPAVQRQAITVALLALAAVALGTLALLMLSEFSFDQVLFEAVSAFATVGLSTGITGQLGGAAQLVLIALMFLGRVGPVAVATALALQVAGRRFRYPEERPIIG